MKNKQIFISGIDTDCGKTYITGLLAFHLRRSGANILTCKLVQTGCVGLAEDIIAHREMMEIPLLPEDESGLTCPFVYSFPASPHLSAAIDQRPFEIEKVHKALTILGEKYELLLIEGAGGLMVPLNSQMLAADYFKATQKPLILVSSSRLGSINHTLLSIDHCMNSGIRLASVIYNRFPDDDEQMAESSFLFIKEWINAKYPKIRLIHGDDLQKNKNPSIAWLSGD